MTKTKPTYHEATALLADRYALRFMALKATGLTNAEIGRRYGLSRERVRQIVARAKARGLLAEA